MPDMFSKAERSEIMRRIASGNTMPEQLLRKALFNRGFRYRINVKSLPGKPDVVLHKYKTVILIHGCFWHHHKNCRYAKIPKSNVRFWKKKILSNVNRDLFVKRQLRELNWNVIIVWECNIRHRLKQTVNITIQRVLNNPN